MALIGALLGAATGVGEADAKTAFDFDFVSIEGDPMPLSQFDGKALLVVNTASFCGFTRQYADLQKTWDAYKERGLVVIGVPSNDFGAQEPGKADEIQEFCEANFGIDFPMTKKQVVKGADAHPFYQWAGSQVGAVGKPKWNFHKYLIAPDGSLADWFSTHTNPSSKKVAQAIEKVLPAQ